MNGISRYYSFGLVPETMQSGREEATTNTQYFPSQELNLYNLLSALSPWPHAVLLSCCLLKLKNPSSYKCLQLLQSCSHCYPFFLSMQICGSHSDNIQLNLWDGSLSVHLWIEQDLKIDSSSIWNLPSCNIFFLLYFHHMLVVSVHI